MKIITIILLLLATSLHSSVKATDAGQSALQLGILNKLTLAFKEAEAAHDVEKMARLAKQIATLEKTFETTKMIYEHYQNAVEAVETVSSLIKTAKEVDEFYDYVLEISDAYAKYGIGYNISSLYQFDKVLNPDNHDKYAMALAAIYQLALDEVADMKMVIQDYIKGGIKATEYERWIEILSMHENIRTLLVEARNIVFTIEYILPIKEKECKSRIEFRESFFNYETYAD